MIIARSLCTLQGSVLCVFSSQISYVYIYQRRIQEFQNWGAQSRRGRIPKSGGCFEAPSHIPYVLVVRVVNKIHIINIVFWPKSKYMRVIQSKITKTIPQNFSNRGSRPTRQSWIRLCEQDKLNISYHGNRWHKLYCFCNMRIYKVVFKVSFEFKYFVEQNTWRVCVW